jgi:hypothetical protein
MAAQIAVALLAGTLAMGLGALLGDVILMRLLARGW